MKALALLSAVALFGLTSGSPVSRRDIQEITETTVDFGNLRLQYTFFQRAFATNVSAYIHDDDVDQRTSKFVDNLNDAVGLQSSKNAWYLNVTHAFPSITVNVGIGYSNADDIVAQDTWEVINRFIVDTSEHSATACARIWIPSDCNDGDPAKAARPSASPSDRKGHDTGGGECIGALHVLNAVA